MTTLLKPLIVALTRSFSNSFMVKFRLDCTLAFYALNWNISAVENGKLI